MHHYPEHEALNTPSCVQAHAYLDEFRASGFGSNCPDRSGSSGVVDHLGEVEGAPQRFVRGLMPWPRPWRRPWRRVQRARQRERGQPLRRTADEGDLTRATPVTTAMGSETSRAQMVHARARGGVRALCRRELDSKPHGDSGGEGGAP